MKLSVQTSYISLRQVGLLVSGAGTSLTLVALVKPNPRRAAYGVLLFLVGLAPRRSHSYLVRREPGEVLEGVKRTLRAMSLGYKEAPCIITVEATGTIVRVRGGLGLSMLSFQPQVTGSPKEAYIEATLVRFQAHVRT